MFCKQYAKLISCPYLKLIKCKFQGFDLVVVGFVPWLRLVCFF